MAKRRWTKTTAKSLRSLASRVGLDAAGEEHGVSGERVRQVIEQFGLPRVDGRLKTFPRGTLLRASKAPTLKAAAELLGVGIDTVRAVFARAGMDPPRFKPWRDRIPEALARRVASAYDSGKIGLVKAAEQLGMKNHHTAREFLASRGVEIHPRSHTLSRPGKEKS